MIQQHILINEPTPFISLNGKRSKQEWRAIRQHMVDSLGEYLQQPIEIIDSSIEESIVDDEALCCAIRSLPTNSPLALTWEGRLGMDIIEEKPYVSTSLFLFSQGERITTAEQTSSYLELVYEPSESTQGAWRTLGWIEDIYGEFEHITEYTGR